MYEFLEWQVRDVMSDPLTISPDTTIADAEALLETEGFNAVPVVDDAQELVGIVTTLDLLAAFRFSEDTLLPPYADIMKRPVSCVMTTDLQTVWPRTPLTRVLEKMLDSRSKSFPVLDDGRLVGIVAREDVIEALRRADAGDTPK